MQIGFIGQGFIGKNYADEFESRGYEVTRYALEEPYKQNKDKIADCDIVFIAVPTPTTPDGFDATNIRNVLPLVGNGKTAVVKSTILPKTTEKLQEEFGDIYVLHSPEFLVEKSAATDAANPSRNILGVPHQTEEYEQQAQDVLDILPDADYETIVHSRDAELVKYGGNCFFYFKVMYFNILYDLAQKLECDFGEVRDAVAHDPRIGNSHMSPVHDSGRGAGGHCFIKDFAAFRELAEENLGSEEEKQALRSLEEMNKWLLESSGKDLDLLKGVYGGSGAGSEQ